MREGIRTIFEGALMEEDTELHCILEEDENLFTSLHKKIMQGFYSKESLMNDLDIAERAVAQRDRIIIWLVAKGRIRRIHRDGCLCGECMILNYIEPIVGRIPRGVAGKVVPFRKKADG